MPNKCDGCGSEYDKLNNPLSVDVSTGTLLHCSRCRIAHLEHKVHALEELVPHLKAKHVEPVIHTDEELRAILQKARNDGILPPEV